MLELEGTIVSIDAMGCQREIASEIVAGGGDYVLQVKGNQPTLQAAVVQAFDDVDETNAAPTKARRRTTKEKSRGRKETRHYTIVPVPKGMSSFAQKWSGLTSIGRVIREVERQGKTTSETSYYICSSDAKVGLFGESARQHWGIENGLHWVMDVTFGEDRSRVRAGHAAENLSFLRRFVISLLKQDASRTSLRQKRKEAGWDTKCLEKLLFQ